MMHNIGEELKQNISHISHRESEMSNYGAFYVWISEEIDYAIMKPYPTQG